MIVSFQPDPELCADPTGLGLAFNLAIVLSLVGFAIQEYMRARHLRQLEALAKRAAAAERISAMLCWLSELRDRELRRACRTIVADLEGLVSMACFEITRCAFAFHLRQREYEQGATAKDIAGGPGIAMAVREARREARAIHRRLELATVCLHLSADGGYRMTLKAVERYVEAFTPTVQRIREAGPQWRRQIPLFEIRMPAQNLTAEDTDFADLNKTEGGAGL